MKSIIEIKKEREQAIEKLLKECGVFWAFSNAQFEENKTPLKDGEKYVDIGAGGFMPSGNKDKYIDGMLAIGEAFEKAIADNKQREAYILYELNNHEAFYTCSIDSTLNALGDEYTHDEVLNVYKKYKAKKHVISN